MHVRIILNIVFKEKNMSGQLATDPLFVGLTRPSMIFGVSIQYAMLNMMVSVTIFIQKL